MNPDTRIPMSAPGGQPSDSHVLDPAIRPQDNAKPLVTTGLDACQRALFFLENLQRHQQGLPRDAALAWERAAFCEIFDHPEPGHRIRRFLERA